MTGLVSWPVAIACGRERSRSPLVAGLASVAVVVAFARAALGGDSEGVSGFAAVWLLVLTFALGAGLVADEVESGHAQLVLLRPVTRAAWFGGRLAGAGFVLAAALSASTLAGVAGAALSPRPPGGAALLTASIALPLAFVELSGWLVALGALSVVSRGWGNVARVLVAVFAWGTLRLTAPLAAGRMPRLPEALGAIEPYLHPRNTGALAQELVLRRSLDLGPLLWNLLWIAAAWTAGVLLLNSVELARRRS